MTISGKRKSLLPLILLAIIGLAACGGSGGGGALPAVEAVQPVQPGGAIEPVLFVDNTVVGGDGSQVSPFATLAEAEAASIAGDTIFVFAGDGTDTGQDSGITLKAGQRLIGQGVGLASRSIPPGASPVISNTALVAPGNTPVAILAGNNEVAGILFQADANEAILGNGVTGFNIHDNTINVIAPNGREGIRLINTTGSGSVTNNTISGSQREGIALNNVEDPAGNAVVTPVTASISLSANTISNSAQEGIRASFDGAGTSVSLSISGNDVSASVNEGIRIDSGPLGATVSADVIGNTLTNNGGVADFQAQANGASSMCVELIDNGNLAGNATFQVDNNTGVAGAFDFFELGNDQLAVRSANITDVAQGACGVP